MTPDPAPVLSDADLGAAIRWLCTIPAEANVRILVRVDGACMDFLSPRITSTTRQVSYSADTLDEVFAGIIADKASITSWIAERAANS